MNGIWHEPIPISGERSSPMRLVLSQKWGMNRHDPFFKYLIEAMDVHAELDGEQVDVFRLSHYDPETNVMSIYLGEGKVLRVDAAGVEVVGNGETGVLLEGPTFFEPWEYTPDHEWRFVPDVIDEISFDEDGDSPITVDDMRLLARVWLLSIYFRNILPTRPIACAVGSTGSGKTEMFRQFGKIIIGPDFDVDSPTHTNDEGARVAVVNRPYVVYDNADADIRWWPDFLARLATGGRFADREKYTNFSEVSVKPDCLLAITSRTPFFRRVDVASRLLIFPMKPPQGSGEAQDRG